MIKVFYFGTGDVPKEAYKKFENLKNLKIFWGFNPEWDSSWSSDKIPPPKELLRENDEIFEIKTIQSLINILEEIKPDIGLVVGSRWIFRSDFFSKFEKKVYNYHPSDLPFFKGAGGMTWQVLHNQKESTVSIHEMNEGVDSGKIVIKNRRFVANKPKLDEFLHVMRDLSIDTIVEFMEKINNQSQFSEVSIDESLGNYFPMLDSKINGAINWMWHGNDLESFIRAFGKPYPGAFTFLGKKKLKINVYDSKFKEGKKYHPFAYGLIIAKNENEIVIAVNGGELVIPVSKIESQEEIEKSLRNGNRLWTPTDIIDESMFYRPSNK